MNVTVRPAAIVIGMALFCIAASVDLDQAKHPERAVAALLCGLLILALSVDIRTEA